MGAESRRNDVASRLHDNPNEWVRFSLTCESIAATFETLQASISFNA